MIGQTAPHGLGGLGLFVLGIGVAASCALDRSGGLFVGTDTGTGGSTSSSTGTGGAGAGPIEECDSPADCQGQDSTCAERTCIGMLCGWSYAAAGTECSDVGGTVCDGAGICVECVDPTKCQPAGCLDGVQTLAETCQNNTCVPGGDSIPCDPYVCDGDQCLTSCDSNTDCAAPNWCDGNTCVPPNPTGTGCDEDYECSTGHCVDGFCCTAPCGGQCEACSQALTQGTNGTCTPIPLWADPEAECGPLGCDGAGTCVTCGYEPTPTGSACPSICSNSCAGNICLIDCSGKDTCKTDTITCPQGLICEIDCPSDHSCASATVHCPDDYACTVTCSANQHSCDAMVFNCSTHGTCTMNCQGGDTCKNANIYCGSNACTATCTGGDHPALHSTSGACSSTGC